MFFSFSKQIRSFFRIISLALVLCTAPVSATAKPDVVFVGAGPVGLYTAIQIKLAKPKAEIAFFEKYTTYKRNQIIRLESESFEDVYPDTALRQLIDGFGDVIHINTMESQLLDFAKALGIQIYYENIRSPKDVLAKFPDLSILVGSDGARSEIRNYFVPEEKLERKDLIYLAEFKYKVTGRSKKLSPLKLFYLMLFDIKHGIQESVHYSHATNESTITLRVRINTREYQALKDRATFAKPILWSDSAAISLIPISLKPTFQMWVDLRSGDAGDTMIPDSAKINSINLTEYYSPKLHFNFEGKDVFLVGDAAFGVPFFRSINNGLKSGNVLASVIGELLAAGKNVVTDSCVNTSSLQKNHTNAIYKYESFFNRISREARKRSAITSFMFVFMDDLMGLLQRRRQL